MKRLFALIAILLIPAVLFAATWTWSSPYEETYGYRYQVNSESEEGWTYVDSSVTEVTIEDATYGDVLYVQLSLDGENWSPSGIAAYVEAIEVEEEPQVEAVEEVATEETPVATIRPSIVGITNERLNRTFEFSFDFDIGTDLYYEYNLHLAPYAGLVLDFKNIYSPSYWFGLGIRTRGGVSFVPNDGNIVNIITPGNLSLGGFLDLNLALSFIVVDSVDLTLALGAGLSANNSSVPTLFKLGEMDFGTYANAGLSIDRYFGRSFHMGIAFYVKYFISDTFSSGLFVNNVGLHFGATF